MHEKQARLNALYQLLSNTDYKAIKASEGYPGDDWEDVKLKRQLWRDEINQLEAGLAQEDMAMDVLS